MSAKVHSTSMYSHSLTICETELVHRQAAPEAGGTAPHLTQCPSRTHRDTYFGLRDLLDPLDFFIRHHIIVSDDVWAIPLIFLFEGGDEELWHPVTMMVPTEELLLPLGRLGSREHRPEHSDLTLSSSQLSVHTGFTLHGQGCPQPHHRRKPE